MSINFVSSKDSDTTRTMHAKSDRIEIMMDSKTDDVIKEIFRSLLPNIKQDQKNKREEVNLFLIMLIY